MKKKANPQIVTSAIIENKGHILSALSAKRKYGKCHTGNWEFPRRTLEKGETCEQCLKRELQEELAITSEIGDLICSNGYSYGPGWTVKLLIYKATVISGFFNLNAHGEIRWVKPGDLTNYEFPEEDRPVIEKLILNDKIFSKQYTP